MFVVALLCTGLAVYLFTSTALQQRMRAQSFEMRTLDTIERMGGQNARTGRRTKNGLYRLIAQLAEKIAPKIHLPEAQLQWLRQDLLQQGIRTRPEEYAAYMLLAVVGGLLLGLYISLITGNSLLPCLLLGGYGGFTVFRFYTGKRKKERAQKIADQFPDMLDLLATSVTAGLGFTQALQYVAEQYRGPLSDEFGAVQRAIALGSTRRAALGEMADRCALQELRTFVGAVVQADELGISLGNILNAQAKEIRLLNRMRKEERAQKVSVKMLLPMAMFILPVLFVVLLAPAVAQAVAAFTGGV